ncbi:MAG TPA: HlyD family type I secretion periplasmic adaptor subunit [Rubrivivax sp.]|nr:HlyD family type I secretion periplasmic adaptor subunit [Burkholderiales bacterium]HNU10605.1 HlyD family type I secretion periplasmic adaptor subunit [Rubrivivax sp.]
MSSSNSLQAAVGSTLATAGAGRGVPPETITDLEARADTRSVMRLGFWVLVVGFGLFLAWAIWAPLDEGVSAPATVSFETRRKVVQHMSGGIVKSVQVKEGQMVSEGELLMVLDDAPTRAAYESMQQTYLSQRAAESRLLAEAAHAPAITFHPDLLRATDPQAAQHMQVQQQLFAARRASYAAEIAAANQTIQGMEAQMSGLRQVLESRRTQAQLQSQQLANVKALAADGFAPQNQALQLEQAQADLRASIADVQTSLQRLQSAVAETRLRIAQREQELTKEVSAQLADVQREVEANRERLVAITEELQRTQVRAPLGGQVLGLAVNGPGAVVTPGMRLMDIVPQGESLLLDAQVPTMAIDRIKVGDVVEVRFTAFANAPQLVADGRLVSLSGDAISEATPMGPHSYFLGRVEITPEGRKALGSRHLLPGMMAEVLVKTGERPLMAYLLHPLTKRIAAAMIEE